MKGNFILTKRNKKQSVKVKGPAVVEESFITLALLTHAKFSKNSFQHRTPDGFINFPFLNQLTKNLFNVKLQISFS